MVIPWDDIRERHDELAQQLASPSLDSSKRHEFQKELSHLAVILEKNKIITDLEKNLHDAQEQASENEDQEMAELFAQEVASLEQDVKREKDAFDDLMFPPSEHDDRSVFLEIRAGTGGQEAALFAADLLKMYTQYAQRKHWKTAVESSSSTDLGGLREVVLHIKGKKCVRSPQVRIRCSSGTACSCDRRFRPSTHINSYRSGVA